MASLTREPSGADRSAISLHLMGLFYPNSLKGRFCMSSKNSTVIPSTSSAHCKKRLLLTIFAVISQRYHYQKSQDSSKIGFLKFHSRAFFVVKLVSSIQVLFGKPFPEVLNDRYSENKTVLIKEATSQRLLSRSSEDLFGSIP